MTSLPQIQANLTAQAEEVFALENIYGEENVTSHHDGYVLHVEVSICYTSGPKIKLKIECPKEYPSDGPPSASVSAPFLSEDTLRWANGEMSKMCRPGVREHIMFTWVEWVKDTEELLPPRKPDEGDLELKKPANHLCTMDGITVLTETGLDALWQHGEPFTEKKSTFQAHLAPADSVDNVKVLMDALLKNNKLQKATHNIMAYRIESSSGAWLQDHDDDGETAAGRRLLHLLQRTNVRNILVVVSRWYGGIKLGPARFIHINRAAQNLMSSHGLIREEGAEQKKRGS